VVSKLTFGADLCSRANSGVFQRIDIHGVELTNERSAVRVSIAKLCSSASPVAEPRVPITMKSWSRSPVTGRK